MSGWVGGVGGWVYIWMHMDERASRVHFAVWTQLGIVVVKRGLERERERERQTDRHTHTHTHTQRERERERAPAGRSRKNEGVFDFVPHINLQVFFGGVCVVLVVSELHPISTFMNTNAHTTCTQPWPLSPLTALPACCGEA